MSTLLPQFVSVGVPSFLDSTLAYAITVLAGSWCVYKTCQKTPWSHGDPISKIHRCCPRTDMSLFSKAVLVLTVPKVSLAASQQ